jgi:hypothetical protein
MGTMLAKRLDVWDLKIIVAIMDKNITCHRKFQTMKNGYTFFGIFFLI